MKRNVAIVTYPDVTLLDVTGPAQVFSAASDLSDRNFDYGVNLVSSDGQLVMTDTGIRLESSSIEEATDWSIDTLLVAGGLGVFAACKDTRLTSWILQKSKSVRRLGSTCMGAFLLAETGLAYGLQITTHWRWCKHLQETYENVKVEPDSLYIKDHDIWTSAGVSAGIDLALAMVEEDCGREMALAVARNLVVYLKRPGGQSQFSAMLHAQVYDQDGRFEKLHNWIASNLNSDLRVEQLASRANMSSRTFSRVYTSKMGLSPGKSVESIRIDAAKQLLNNPTIPIPQVAETCGFHAVERMRRAFVRQLGVSPSAYRRRFGNPR